MTGRVKRALLSMQRYNWEQGVTAQAFLEAGDGEIAIALAVEGANRQSADGRCCHIAESTAVTDPCAVGEALIFAADTTGDPFLQAAREKLLRWAMHDAPRNADGVVYHFTHDRLIWVDSMYMLPPFLAAAGEYDEALHRWTAIGMCCIRRKTACWPISGRIRRVASTAGMPGRWEMAGRWRAWPG